jgi:hypothetical protein
VSVRLSRRSQCERSEWKSVRGKFKASAAAKYGEPVAFLSHPDGCVIESGNRQLRHT